MSAGVHEIVQVAPSDMRVRFSGCLGPPGDLGKVNDGADEHQRQRDEDFISLENDFV